LTPLSGHREKNLKEARRSDSTETRRSHHLIIKLHEKANTGKKKRGLLTKRRRKPPVKGKKSAPKSLLWAESKGGDAKRDTAIMFGVIG